MVCLLCDFKILLTVFNQLPNKPLPRQKPTAEIFSDTPFPACCPSTVGQNPQVTLFGRIVLEIVGTPGHIPVYVVQ